MQVKFRVLPTHKRRLRASIHVPERFACLHQIANSAIKLNQVIRNILYYPNRHNWRALPPLTARAVHSTKSNTFFIHETIDVCMLIRSVGPRPKDEILNYCPNSGIYSRGLFDINPLAARGSGRNSNKSAL